MWYVEKLQYMLVIYSLALVKENKFIITRNYIKFPISSQNLVDKIPLNHILAN